MSVMTQEDLKDVQHPGHLREDQYTVTSCFQRFEKPVQGLQLSAVVLKQGAIGKGDLKFDCDGVQGIERVVVYLLLLLQGPR